MSMEYNCLTFANWMNHFVKPQLTRLWFVGRGETIVIWMHKGYTCLPFWRSLFRVNFFVYFIDVLMSSIFYKNVTTLFTPTPQLKWCIFACIFNTSRKLDSLKMSCTTLLHSHDASISRVWPSNLWHKVYNFYYASELWSSTHDTPVHHSWSLFLLFKTVTCDTTAP